MRPGFLGQGGWLFDVKLDGFRGLCNLEHDRGRVISRGGNLMRRFDTLADQTAAGLAWATAFEPFLFPSRSIARNGSFGNEGKPLGGGAAAR